MAFWKDSMINWLSNIINRNHSAAKISQVLCSSIFPLRPELYSFLTRPEHWAHWLHKEFSHLHEVVPTTRVDVLNAIGLKKVELVNCSESKVAWAIGLCHRPGHYHHLQQQVQDGNCPQVA